MQISLGTLLHQIKIELSRTLRKKRATKKVCFGSEIHLNNAIICFCKHEWDREKKKFKILNDKTSKYHPSV